MKFRHIPTVRSLFWAWLLSFGVFLTCSNGAISQEPDNPAPQKVTDAKSEVAATDDLAKREEELKLMMLFADTFDQIKRNFVHELSDRELMEAAIGGMLTKLDRYSNYIPPKQLEQFKTSVEAEFGGVGIIVSTQNGSLEVISPIIGTPAHRAGMLAGDRIVEIEGQSTSGFSVDDAVKLVKGQIGTTVTLKVIQIGEEKAKSFELMRETIRVPTVLGFSRREEQTWNFFCDTEQKIGYLRISAFGRNTAADLRSALETLQSQEFRALVLDLRGNPGGLLSSSIEISDLFISAGAIVSTTGRNAPERIWEAHEPGTFNDFPMTILINRFSASASEIVAACLQDHGRALVIGERSWGKGSVQNIIELEEGRSAIKLTTASYQRPSGKNIHRFKDSSEDDDWGVQPNDGFEISLSREEAAKVQEYRKQLDILTVPSEDISQNQTGLIDPQLQKAIATILAKLADSESSESADPPNQEPAEEGETNTDDPASGK